MIQINIANDFTRSPAGRFRSDGPFSGERFREEHLRPAIEKSDEQIEVSLDGVLGFGSSFLEEAFGGLVRLGLIDRESINRRLTITSEVETYKRRIVKYMNEARLKR